MISVTAAILVTIGKSVLIPVTVAVLVAVGTMVITRSGEAANRRRDRYAQAVQTLVAWIEFAYRVRRRTDDTPATLTALATLGHDLQERLACHQTWISTESPELAERYARVRSTISTAVGPAIAEAWKTPPVRNAAEMNLGGWGPASACTADLVALQRHIEARFGLRRLLAWARRHRGSRHRAHTFAETPTGNRSIRAL